MNVIHALARQYSRPHGLAGRLIGAGMSLINRRANEWTLSLLDVQADDNILELGFGPGDAIASLLSRVVNGTVAGIDLSPTMLAQATRRNLPAVRAGRADLRCGDAARIPFADASFDKVLAINVIYFWKDPVQILGEVRRVTKEGGRVAVYIGDRDQMSKVKVTQTGLFHLYTAEECRKQMEAAGLRNVRCETTAIRQGPVSKAACVLAER